MGHRAPFIFLPQLPFTHLRPLTQSASLVQAPKHCLVAPLHEKGAQTVAAPNLQAPEPSHTKVLVTASPSHAPALQTDPDSYLRHLPVPSQVPSRPQVVTSWATH